MRQRSEPGSRSTEHAFYINRSSVVDYRIQYFSKARCVVFMEVIACPSLLSQDSSYTAKMQTSVILQHKFAIGNSPSVRVYTKYSGHALNDVIDVVACSTCSTGASIFIKFVVHYAVEKPTEESIFMSGGSTLGELYGPQFEAALIKLMLKDERFASYAGAHLNEDMFLKPHYKEIAGAFAHIFKSTNGKSPSRASVEAELRMRRASLNGSGGSKALRLDKALSRLPVLEKKQLTLADEEHIKNNLQNYILHRKALRAITDSIDMVETGEFDKIAQTVSEAVQSGKLFSTSDVGLMYFDSNKRFQAYTQKDVNILRSPTGIPKLDKMMRGGLEPGKLGIVVAPPGTGKTLLLISIGAKALQAGMNVVHITLEIDQAETSIRYDAHLLKLPINELVRRYKVHKNRIMQQDKKMGKLIIREWGPSEVSASDIRAYIRYLENAHKFKPDVIIVDYADLLKSMRIRNSELTEMADTYRALRQIAKDGQCRVWSASQVNKEGMNQETLSLKDMYGTGEKSAVPDVVIGLCQTPAERRNRYMRIINLKNRQGGREGTVIDCDTNTALQQITQSDVQRSRLKNE